MSEKDEGKEHKQVTQAIAQQPQEEFISPENQPSKDESEVTERSGTKDGDSPQR